MPSRSFTKKGKPRADAKDIEKLLSLLNTYTFEGVHFDQELFETSKDHVREYRSIFPGHANTWRRLGYKDIPQSPDIMDSTIPQPEPLSFPEHEDDTLLVTETGLPDHTGLTRIQMICLAGKMTIDILKDIGCSGAIFGSLACFLYGNQRSPNDVDVLVLPPDGVIVSMEDIKSVIVELDPAHLFLISARDPQATYRILYFRLTDGLGVLTPRTSCKVDIVAPGNMHLPPLPSDMINWDEGLPLIPFSLLLLQKLQNWDDHRKSLNELKRLKQVTDFEDIEDLFELSEIKALQSSSPWSDRQVFSTKFEALSRDRVKQYCFLFPDSADGWRSIGFETQELEH
ncbi:hypothetical protein BDZ94DRAFT_1252213 [Collybia nuda]|uniref:Uncharacterized protein n=1 Tax=Collybia nuda TaxID=64659 RepID=A0A9P6CH79_9AGAR|nr:hypothetical protein BDZ94DRAFT_1252213 [Collybia nuda]